MPRIPVILPPACGSASASTVAARQGGRIVRAAKEGPSRKKPPSKQVQSPFGRERTREPAHREREIHRMFVDSCTGIS
ncbi:hypothetical protein KM043_011303 [Ampulex compressa]|nr:hypothetical protein KM043_011303 [Ampulex compressa]